MTPLSFSLAITFLTLVVYLVIGLSVGKRKRTWDVFFLNNRSLNSSEFSASFAASSTSLATVLVFFLSYGASEGLAILVGPISYFIGAYVFASLVEKIEKAGFLLSGNTMAEFAGSLYESKLVSISVALIGLLGIIAVLLVELYIGSQILSSFFVSDIKPYILIIICLIVFIYVMGGGFSAVVRTDRIQITLVYCAVISLLAWLITKAPSAKEVEYLPHPLFTEGRFILPTSLLVNIIFVNILLLPAQVRSWQMAAASRSSKDLRTGLVRGAFSTLILWCMISFAGIFLAQSIGDTPNINNVIQLLTSTESGYAANYVVLPLLFAAATAALLSTADSALVPMLQSVAYDVIQSKSTERSSVTLIWILGALSLLIVLSLYYLIIVGLGYDFYELLFTVFGIFIVITPVILLGMYFPHLARTRIGALSATFALCCGIISNLWASYSGSTIDDGISLVQIAGPIGVTTSFSILFASMVFLHFSTNRKINETN